MAQGDFTLKVEEVPPDSVVVRMTGFFNTEAAQPLQKQLTTGVSQRAGTIVIDMSGVKFMSSTALGVLIALHKRMKLQGGGKVRVAAMPGPIEHMFKALCLHQAIGLFPTVQEALAAP